MEDPLPSNDLSLLKEQLKKTKNVSQRIRLCVLIARANGHSPKIISSILHISESAVYKYFQEYDNEKKTINKVFPGRACKLDKEQEAELKAYIDQFSYESIGALCSYIKEKYNLSYTNSGLRYWLIRNNRIRLAN